VNPAWGIPILFIGVALAALGARVMQRSRRGIVGAPTRVGMATAGVACCLIGALVAAYGLLGLLLLGL